MKKLFIAAVTAVALVGCAGNKNTKDSDTAPATPQDSTGTSTTTDPGTTTPPPGGTGGSGDTTVNPDPTMDDGTSGGMDTEGMNTGGDASQQSTDPGTGGSGAAGEDQDTPGEDANLSDKLEEDRAGAPRVYDTATGGSGTGETGRPGLNDRGASSPSGTGSPPESPDQDTASPAETEDATNSDAEAPQQP